MKIRSFASVRRSVRWIRFLDAYSRARLVLKPGPRDVRYENRRLSVGNISGTGKLRDPFTYVNAASASASPHYGLIDLWYAFRERVERETVFIMVNKWVFQVERYGLIGADDRFIQLV